MLRDSVLTPARCAPAIAISDSMLTLCITQNQVDVAKGLGRGGSVINVASFVAKMGAATPQLACTSAHMSHRAGMLNPSPLPDTASKGAVLAMTRELAMVHAREGIRFNALCPSVLLLVSHFAHQILSHAELNFCAEALCEHLS